MFKSFSSTLADLPRSFSCCLSSYSVQNSLAPASGERNSTVDVILGVLKTRQVDGGSSRVCKFLIKKTVRDHFLEIFCKLQSTFKKSEQEFVFSSVQTLYRKSATLVKRRLLKISRRATFRNIPCTCQISGQSCKTLKFSVTLLKSDSTTDAVQPILKFWKQTKKIFAVESVFELLLVGGLDSSNVLKGTLLKTFF